MNPTRPALSPEDWKRFFKGEYLPNLLRIDPDGSCHLDAYALAAVRFYAEGFFTWKHVSAIHRSADDIVARPGETREDLARLRESMPPTASRRSCHRRRSNQRRK